MEEERREHNSISRRLRQLIAAIVPLSVIYICVSIFGTYYFRMKIVDYTETFVDYYMEKIETTVSNINRRMGMLILGEGETEIEANSYISEIQTTENIAFRNYFISRLRDVLQMYSMEYGNEYHFFAFFPADSYYIYSNADEYPDKGGSDKYHNDITDKLSKGELIPNSGSPYWQFVEGEEGCNYIIKFYSIKEIYVGCWIRPDDLIAPLENAVKDGKNSALLFDGDNKQIAGKKEDIAGGAVIERKFVNLPFHVRMVIHDYGLFQTTIGIQLVLLGIAFSMLFVTLSSTYSLYNRVMKPIRKFSDNLERLSKGITGMEDISVSELTELEQANTEFRQLLKRINSLQDEVYESEIKKQLVYMEYLKLQIEPHFYLNCLNFIYNMIDLGKTEQASRMAVMTSEYMRYLFHKGQEPVTVSEELKHIGHYLEIQKLRFEHAFDYYIECEEEVKAEKIPPLIIQTFVENCMKYAVDLNSRLSITVTVFSEETEGAPYLNICVIDSGPGFSGEILEQLSDRKKYMEQENNHIGIANTLKRLYYTYGERAEIAFYNAPVKGAVVDMHIPCKREPEALRQEEF